MQDRLILYSLRRWVPSIWSTLIGIKNPRVGIVNIGAEEEKGNALVKETFPLLKRMRRISILLEVWKQERFRMDRRMSSSVKHLRVILFLKLYRRCRKLC